MQIFYLKLEKHCRIVTPEVRIGDIADVCCVDKVLQEKLKETLLITCDIKQHGQKKILPVLDVIDALQKAAENDIYVCSIGADAVVIDLDFEEVKNIRSKKRPLKNKKISEIYKVIPVMLVTFVGSAFAIMAYNEDAQIGGVFKLLTGVMGGGADELRWMAAAYGVGIAAGVMIFFNHFGKKKLNDEPTPMEVEMAKYEADLIDTQLSAEKKRKADTSP